MSGAKQEEDGGGGGVLATLFPGEKVTLDLGDEKTLTATVYPLGFRHIRGFTSKVSGVAGRIATMTVVRGDAASMDAQIAAQLLPFAVDELIDMADRCVKFDAEDVTLPDLPHYLVPPILETWIATSFGEERMRSPWVRAVKTILDKLGVTSDLSQIWARFFQPSSPAATVSKTS